MLHYERRNKTAALLKAVGVQPSIQRLKLVGAATLVWLTVLCVVLPKMNRHKARLT
jgi:hypothetical protein